MQPLDLAPWDALPLWVLPKAFSVSVGITATLIAPADPTRYWLSIGLVVNASGSIGISTDPGITTQSCQSLTATYPFRLAYPTDGPIVCAAWYGIAVSGAITVNVVAHTLKSWADQGQSLDSFLRPASLPPVAIRPTRGPGVGGGRGIIDYWNSIRGTPPRNGTGRQRPNWLRPISPLQMRS
jgi:hypothetical protein